MSKQSSTLNYLQFGPNWVQIGHSNPEIEKLESFEEDGQEITERPRLEAHAVSEPRRGRVQTLQHPQLHGVWSKFGLNRTQESRDRKTGEF